MLTKNQIKAIQKQIAKEDERVPIMLGALGDPGRFRIVTILMKRRDVCVSDIAEILGITVSAASQQLRVLERIGIVRRKRMGQMICYEVRDDDSFVRSLCKIFTM